MLNETVEDDDNKANLPDDWEEGLTFTAKSSRKYSFNPISLLFTTINKNNWGCSIVRPFLIFFYSVLFFRRFCEVPFHFDFFVFPK